jgi:hypothetical protein
LSLELFGMARAAPKHAGGTVEAPEK